MLSTKVSLAGAKDVAKASATVPILSPAVVRSLYRCLYREVSKLDANPVAKTLFPCTAELQAVMGVTRPLYVPGSKSYRAVLQKVFRDGSRASNVKLAFETLNRLRAHDENVQVRLPALAKERDTLLRSLAVEAPKHAELYRAQPLPLSAHSGPQYVPAAPNTPSKVVLRDRGSVELAAGTVLLAHPLSSTHVDRRVMIITERTPVLTSGVVLDLQFIFPVSRGNPMFSEVFWGHEMYDGGFNQINLTMPPTAQVVVLHTLEPPTESEEADMQAAAGSAATTDNGSISSWLRWGRAASVAKGAAGGPAPKTQVGSERRAGSLRRQHELLCQPLIKGERLASGAVEPTLYVSKVEALPYLSRLATGQPRSSLRLYWGSMRWLTSQIEAEVGNGHWFPVKVSPSFFGSYSLTPDADLRDNLRRRKGGIPTAGPAAAQACFPTEEDLAAARRVREKRLGADIAILQVFPAEGAIRRRECLWDEMLYALGGEYASLVGGFNPFVLDGSQRSAPQILAPLLPGTDAAAAAPLAVSEAVDTDADKPPAASQGSQGGTDAALSTEDSTAAAADGGAAAVSQTDTVISGDETPSPPKRTPPQS